jgi:FKBP-type peptidyl-prolyl cis-trans isomerase FkpA
MTRTARFALITALFVSGCGGAEEPPPQQPSTAAPPSQPASTSAQGATADKPDASASAPPSQPASTSAQGATADKTVDKPVAPVAPAAPVAPKTPPARPAYTRTDLQVGTGREAQKGQGLSVHYTGWLYDPTQPEMKGRMFDSSRDRGPFNFQLGAGQVIPGWDQGFDGMKVGGRRRLIIPPSLGYGVDGAGGGIIPPNATLIFEMELLDVQ